MQKPQIWVIGSAADCDLVVDRPTVSGHHCRLVKIGEKFFLDDLDSTNGTFVNGNTVRERTEISRSDQILLGSNVAMPWPNSTQLALPEMAPALPAGPKSLPRSAGNSLPAKGLMIGREEGNDIVLPYPMVSARHARIVPANGSYLLEDLGSSNGTFLNSPSNRIQKSPLNPTDVVYFGSMRVPASRLIGKTVKAGAQSQQEVGFRGEEMVLGRDPSCDQVLAYPMISGRHARIFRRDGSLLVEDLGSANGTFVNGHRIRGATPIEPGDTIGLGSFTFRLTANQTFERRDYRGNVTIEAKDVSVVVPGKKLLEEISLTIYPTEFVGLMGPSGAGKTTLMNALNGYTRPTSGQILFNGQDLYENYGQFAHQLGYVPQDDIIHRDLTVGQALYYTAKLRLPPDTSDEEIRARIKKVIKQLGLEGTEEVLIGSPEKKGISGGQRKRVNLAMELLTDPSVLFLDEPT
ncbi:MAG: FHA domain-containing protein, partial [Planctomycetaceae bacterium]|nr:FHA domain-containing protein [Planctomycetaceae bacterium]